MVKVAAIQMSSTADLSENLRLGAEQISRATDQGAELLVLPENFPLMGEHEQDKIGIAEPFGQGVIQDFLAQQARHHGIWLLGGTIPLQSDDKDKVYASCLLYDQQGKCTNRYDKIHLFDVQIDEESYSESDTFQAGDAVIVAETPLANIGISVCYDLRFPELYRAMHKNQLNIIVVVAAFTEATGKAHWASLLRSRAIENLCFVVAANQFGEHANGRQTWGHSMIIDPWGGILDCIEQGEGFAIAELDLQKQIDIRRRFPCLKHQILN